MSIPEGHHIDYSLEAQDALTEQVVLAREQAFNVMHHTEPRFNFGKWYVGDKTEASVVLYKNTARASDIGALALTDFGDDGLLVQQLGRDGKAWEFTLLSNSAPRYWAAVDDGHQGLRADITRRRIQPASRELLGEIMQCGEALNSAQATELRLTLAGFNYVIEEHRQTAEAARQHAAGLTVPQPYEP